MKIKSVKPALELRNLFYNFITYLLFKRFTRKYLITLFERIVDLSLQPGRKNAFCSNNRRIIYERRVMARSIISSISRTIANGNLSYNTARHILELWSNAVSLPREQNPVIKAFDEQKRCKPPWFLVISPGHACNLKCKDCYASSLNDGAKLTWPIFQRIIEEAKRLWDIKLVVFSGGEPFAYRSEGKSILDIVEQNPDILFLAFTNGTLIDNETAFRMGEMGNITTAFSVEGMRQVTDERRGKGIFDKVLQGMENMRKAGVPFGISATVNRENCDKLLSDEFLDYFFYTQDAFYAFYFQYLPIGRNVCFDMMPSPQQRFEFWQKTWQIIEKKNLFLIDFWNHGPIANGCIAAGRDGGYLHIDWNGEVMPCVFTPYSVGNVNNTYQQNGTLNDLWNMPFLNAIRRWQIDYGYGNAGLTINGNWLKPCPYRDHHKLFMQWLEQYKPEPENESAAYILNDSEYHHKLIEYDHELNKVFDLTWRNEYIDKQDY